VKPEAFALEVAIFRIADASLTLQAALETLRRLSVPPARAGELKGRLQKTVALCERAIQSLEASADCAVPE
jgi:hypothetical protein